MVKHNSNLSLKSSIDARQTKKERILEFLLTGCRIDPGKCWQFFKTQKLATRISELRAEEWDIQHERIDTEDGEYYYEYFL